MYEYEKCSYFTQLHISHYFPRKLEEIMVEGRNGDGSKSQVQMNESGYFSRVVIITFFVVSVSAVSSAVV